MKLRRSLAVTAALTLGLVPLRGQIPLPTDTTIRTGTLTSGMQYFLVRSARQPDRVLVELAVKAGSIDEADDQRGVAHLLEHMAFNGSAHFKPGEMMAYFKAIGAPIGAHVNAATSLDSTRYFMEVPVAQDAAVRRAFEAMRDVADGLTLNAAELVRERRVVTEEWRLRLGPAERLRQPMDLAILGGSRYAARPVLGDIDRLATMPIDRVRRFYQEHYHPDRMALVVVGGMPTADMEARVHDTFDSLPANPSGPRAVPDSPRHSETRYAAFSDPEVRSASVGVSFVTPRPPIRTVEDLDAEILQIMAAQLMNDRFAALARQAGAPYQTAGVRLTAPLLNTTVTAFTAQPTIGNPSQALPALVQEIARAREHGFTSEELGRARGAALAWLQVIGPNNQAIAGALLTQFLRGEPMPSPTQRLNAALPFVARLTNDDVRTAIRAAWSDTNRIVTSVAPATPGSTPATEAALRQAVKVADAATVLPPWQPPPTIAATATPVLPPPGKVASRRDDTTVGITVLTLSNGVDVWLKPMPFTPSPAARAPVTGPTVAFAALARGGASVAPSASRPEALLAAQLVAAAGVGGLTPAQRAQLQPARPVTVQPFVTANAHGMNFTARTPDVDAALTLAHLFFTAPNDDVAAFDRVKAALRARVQMQNNDPAAAFQSRVSAINTGSFAPAPTAEEIAGVDPAAALRFYRERFSNAADFTLFAAGPFDINAITPLLEKYVGSLPSTGTARPVGAVPSPSFPPSVVREIVRRGREPRSQVTLTFFAKAADAAGEERAAAVAVMLRERVYSRLRGVMGATYTVTASSGATGPEFGTITLSFVCAPDAAASLTQAALDEARNLARDGPTEQEAASTRAARLGEWKDRLVQNTFWISMMERAWREGRAVSSIAADPAAIVAPLTADALKEAARQFLPENRYTVVTLLPEAQ